MGPTASLMLLIGGDAGPAIAAIDKTKLKMDELGAKSTEAHGRIGKFMGLVGTAALYAGGAIATAAVIGGVAAIKQASSFQQAMELIRTQAGDTTDSMSTMKDQALQISAATGASADQVAASWYHVASAGYTGKQAYDMVLASAKLAAVGQSNLEDTTKAVVNTMKSGIPGIHSAGDAIAYVNAIVGNGDMRMQDFTSAMSSGILPIAGQVGVSMQSLGAAMAYMTDRGVPAERSAQMLRRAFTLMDSPSIAAQKQLKAIGMTQFQMADDLRKPNGIMVALQDLRSHMSGLSKDQQNAEVTKIFGAYSSGPVMMMMSNLDGLKQKYDAIGKSTGNFASAWKKESGTFANSMGRLKSTADAALITIGLKLLPVGEKLVKWAAKELPLAIAAAEKWLKQNKGTLKTIGHIITTLLVVAFNVLTGAISFFAKNAGWLAPLLTGIVASFVAWQLAMAAMAIIATVSSLIEGLGVAIDFALGPVGLILIAIAALVFIAVLLVTHWKQVEAFTKKVFNSLPGPVKTALEAIGNAIKFVFNWVVHNWPLLLAILTGPIGLAIYLIHTHFAQIRSFIQTVVSDIEGFFQKLPGRIISFISGLPGDFLSLGQNIAKALINGVKNMIGGLGSTITNALKSIPGMAQVEGLLGAGINLIPHASGFSLDRATHLGGGHIGGEAGREHMLPELQFSRLANIAAKAGAQAASSSGMQVGSVTINHPETGVDIMQSIQNASYLAAMQNRGTLPQAWPA